MFENIKYAIFGTNSTKIIIIGFIALIIIIPASSYLISQRIKAAKTPKSYDKTVTKEATQSAREVPKQLPKEVLDEDDKSNSLSDSSAKLNFGATLDFKVSLQGRPSSNQSSKLFLGLADGGQEVQSPKYLLSFNVDIPVNGGYSGLSIAGLTQGNTYTAYLKGRAQIASASAFFVKPSISELNNGNPLILLTGDLNEDNMINSSDYSIAKAALGSNASSGNWNAIVDFNLDGRINNFDLAIIVKNLGRVGAGGAWVSKPGVATSSGGLKELVNQASNLASESSEPIKPPVSTGGYWIWVPEF